MLISGSQRILQNILMSLFCSSFGDALTPSSCNHAEFVRSCHKGEQTKDEMCTPACACNYAINNYCIHIYIYIQREREREIDLIPLAAGWNTSATIAYLGTEGLVGGAHPKKGL